MTKFLATFLFLLIIGAQLVAQKRDWKLFDEMPTPLAGAEIVTYNDKIYILGGYTETGGEPISTIQMYDPSMCEEKRWSIVGHMQTPRANFVAKYNEEDSSIYIAGGTTGFRNENVPTMEKWSFQAKASRTILDDIRIGRTGASGEIWQNYLIIIGGYNNSLPQSRLEYLAIYNLRSGEIWLPKAAILSQEQYNHASTILDGSIYIFGGVRFGISDRIYNINLDALAASWPPSNFGEVMPRIHPDLEFPRASFEAITTAKDTVWLIGGNSEDSTALHTTTKFIIKEYNKNKGYELERAPSLLYARKELVAAQLDDVIYVFGGVDEHGKVLSTVEALIDSVIDNPCTDDTTAVRHQSDDLTYILHQNYPNPFNGSTTIDFELPSTEFVTVEIYNSQGQIVARLINDILSAGHHHVMWDGLSSEGEFAPSGVYLYKLTTQHNSQTRKMLLVK